MYVCSKNFGRSQKDRQTERQTDLTELPSSSPLRNAASRIARWSAGSALSVFAAAAVTTAAAAPDDSSFI